MLKVAIKRNWNAPGDKLFFSRNSPVEVDDDLLPHLPSDAVILDSSGKGDRNETRKRVLKLRHELGLDKPTDQLPMNEVLSDEQIMAELTVAPPAKAKA